MEEVVGCRFERTTDLRDLLKNPQFERYPLIMLMLTGFVTFTSLMLARILREHALLKFMLHGESCLRNPIWRTFYGRFGPTALADAQKSIEKRKRYLKEKGRLNVRWALFGWGNSKDGDEVLSNEEGYVHKGELIWRVLLISCAISFFCCLLNVAGGIGGKLPSLWALTNLINVQSDVSGIIPAHVMLGFLLTGSILVTCLYHQMTTRNTNTDNNKTTVLLRNILPADCNENVVKVFFWHHTLQVKNVEFIKDLAQVNLLEKELAIYQQTIDKLSDIEKSQLVRVKWNARHRVTKLEYYNQQVAHYKKEFDEASRQVAFSGVAFVEFASENEAQQAVNLFNLTSKLKILLSRTSDQLSGKRLRWVAAVSPNRSDIKWDNLNAPVTRFYEASQIVRWIATIGVFAAGLTLPALFVEWAGKTTDSALMKNVVLPQLKFVMTLLTLMLLVKIDTKGHHITKTRFETGMMYISFYFQIFADLVFPLLKLSNFYTLYRWTVHLANHGDPWPRFECALRPTYGIHLTRSIVASTTVRNVMMLLRIPHLVPELFSRFWCKSSTEAALRLANKTVTFDFGARYAELLYQHAIAATCVIAHPLVTVFSVPCAILRHKVDQFCFRSVYAVTSRDDSLHRQAFPFIFKPHIITSGTLVVFNVLRDAELGLVDSSSALTVASLLWFAGVCVTVVVGYLLAWEHTWFRMGDSDDDSADLD